MAFTSEAWNKTHALDNRGLRLQFLERVRLDK